MLTARPIIVACLICAATGAQANWSWLRGAAVTGFEDSDWQMLQEATATALVSLEAGASTAWKNEETDNGGSITILRIFEIDEHPCRRAKFRQEARDGAVGEAIFNVCSGPEGWKLVSDTETRRALQAHASRTEKSQDP